MQFFSKLQIGNPAAAILGIDEDMWVDLEGKD